MEVLRDLLGIREVTLPLSLFRNPGMKLSKLFNFPLIEIHEGGSLR